MPRVGDPPRRLSALYPRSSFATFVQKSVLIFSPDSLLSQSLQSVPSRGGDGHLLQASTANRLTIVVPAPLLVLRCAGFEKERGCSTVGAPLSLEPRCERRRRGTGKMRCSTHASKAAIAAQCVRSIQEDPGVRPCFVSLGEVANTTVVLNIVRVTSVHRGAAKQPPITFLSQRETQ